jgi:hypothetical protein
VPRPPPPRAQLYFFCTCLSCIPDPRTFLPQPSMEEAGVSAAGGGETKKPGDEEDYKHWWVLVRTLHGLGLQRHTEACLRWMRIVRPFIIILAAPSFVVGAVGAFTGSERLALCSWLVASTIPVLRFMTFDARVLLGFTRSFEVAFILVRGRKPVPLVLWHRG